LYLEVQGSNLGRDTNHPADCPNLPQFLPNSNPDKPAPTRTPGILADRLSKPHAEEASIPRVQFLLNIPESVVRPDTIDGERTISDLLATHGPASP
jgi:hypothetical protein